MLEQWARRRTTAQALAQRARIVLACADGPSNSDVPTTERVSRPTLERWRRRSMDRRCERLLDEPKPGAPRRITDADVERVMTTTLETTPRDATHCSTRLLARQCGMSRTAVARIRNAFALQPHRSDTFKLSRDPLFIEKVRDIVGLNLNSPDRALVSCVDEKSQIQALDRTAPLLPMRPGQVERPTHDYARHGTTSPLALNAKTGDVIGQCFRRHRGTEFRKFLDLVDQHVPADFNGHLILDNYDTHKTALVQRWLAKRPRYHLRFPPTSASWVNLVEWWFVELDRKQIKRGAHRGVTGLERAIYDHVDITGADPKPLVWTKTADEIFAHIARLCQRIPDSGHYLEVGRPLRTPCITGRVCQAWPCGSSVTRVYRELAVGARQPVDSSFASCVATATGGRLNGLETLRTKRAVSPVHPLDGDPRKAQRDRQLPTPPGRLLFPMCNLTGHDRSPSEVSHE